MAKASKKPASQDVDLEKMSFEAAYARLETVLAQLEQGDLPLDASLALYEEGARLAKHCGTQLDEAELRVRQWQPGDETPDFDEWADEPEE